MTRTQYSPDLKHKIIEEIENNKQKFGSPYTSHIARKYGVNVSTVNAWLYRATTPSKKKAYAQSVKDEAIRRIKSNLTKFNTYNASEVDRDLNLSPGASLRWFHSAKLHVPNGPSALPANSSEVPTMTYRELQLSCGNCGFDFSRYNQHLIEAGTQPVAEFNGILLGSKFCPSCNYNMLTSLIAFVSVMQLHKDMDNAQIELVNEEEDTEDYEILPDEDREYADA